MGVSGSNRPGNSRSSAPDGRRAAGGAKPAAAAAADVRLTFEIRSELAAGRDVQTRILDALRDSGFEGNNFFAVNLALEEALVNAKRAEIMIEDEGPGFDRAAVPDPTTADNLEKCSGRGILLIEAYMNRVTWDRGGRRLRMVKLNKPDRAADR